MPKASTRLADVFNLPASYFTAIFCILQAGSLYPIFAHRVISLNDLQNHLARVWILLHYGDMSAIHKFYRVQWQMLPNLAIDAFGYVFGCVLSLEVTGKVFVATTFILLLGGSFIFITPCSRNGHYGRFLPRSSYAIGLC